MRGGYRDRMASNGRAVLSLARVHVRSRATYMCVYVGVFPDLDRALTRAISFPYAGENFSLKIRGIQLTD